MHAVIDVLSSSEGNLVDRFTYDGADPEGWAEDYARVNGLLQSYCDFEGETLVIVFIESVSDDFRSYGPWHR